MKTKRLMYLVAGAPAVLLARAAEAVHPYSVKAQPSAALPALEGHPVLMLAVNFGMVALIMLLGAIIMAAVMKPPSRN